MGASLLSLVRRELNTVHIAQGRSEIPADLLAGSHATILTELDLRVVGDQPTGVPSRADTSAIRLY